MAVPMVAVSPSQPGLTSIAGLVVVHAELERPSARRSKIECCPPPTRVISPIILSSCSCSCPNLIKCLFTLAPARKPPFVVDRIVQRSQGPRGPGPGAIARPGLRRSVISRAHRRAIRGSWLHRVLRRRSLVGRLVLARHHAALEIATPTPGGLGRLLHPATAWSRTTAQTP